MPGRGGGRTVMRDRRGPANHPNPLPALVGVLLYWSIAVLSAEDRAEPGRPTRRWGQG